MSYDSLIIGNERVQVGLNEQGGYVTSWRVRDGQGSWDEVLYIGSSIKRGGIPILFPYFGKAERWPQHGFARNSTWRVAVVSQMRAVLELAEQDLTAEVRAWYGFSFVATLVVELSESGELLYSLVVKNTGAEKMPISPGVHPYWRINHADKNVIVIDGVEDFDAASFDWENSPPDNVYGFSGSAVVHFPGREIVIEDVSEKSVVTQVVVWSLTPVRDADFDFVCIEPTTGWNFAIDTSPIWVEPGEEWCMKLRFTV